MPIIDPWVKQRQCQNCSCACAKPQTFEAANKIEVDTFGNETQPKVTVKTIADLRNYLENFRATQKRTAFDNDPIKALQEALEEQENMDLQGDKAESTESKLERIERELSSLRQEVLNFSKKFDDVLTAIKHSI